MQSKFKFINLHNQNESINETKFPTFSFISIALRLDSAAACISLNPQNTSGKCVHNCSESMLICCSMQIYRWGLCHPSAIHKNWQNIGRFDTIIAFNIIDFIQIKVFNINLVQLKFRRILFLSVVNTHVRVAAQRNKNCFYKFPKATHGIKHDVGGMQRCLTICRYVIPLGVGRLDDGRV